MAKKKLYNRNRCRRNAHRLAKSLNPYASSATNPRFLDEVNELLRGPTLDDQIERARQATSSKSCSSSKKSGTGRPKDYEDDVSLVAPEDEVAEQSENEEQEGSVVADSETECNVSPPKSDRASSRKNHDSSKSVSSSGSSTSTHDNRSNRNRIE